MLGVVQVLVSHLKYCLYLIIIVLVHVLPLASLGFLTIEILKPGSHKHKHKDRINKKIKHDISFGTCEDKATRIFLIFSLVQLFAYAWTMILCLCLGRS